MSVDNDGGEVGIGPVIPNEVFALMEKAFQEDGRVLSIRVLRRMLGNRGSHTTIDKYWRVWIERSDLVYLIRSPRDPRTSHLQSWLDSLVAEKLRDLIGPEPVTPPAEQNVQRSVSGGVTPPADKPAPTAGHPGGLQPTPPLPCAAVGGYTGQGGGPTDNVLTPSTNENVGAHLGWTTSRTSVTDSSGENHE